jgi:hypothetical protein
MENTMKKLIIGLTLMMSMAAFASDYDNSEFCNISTKISSQEAQRLTSEDTIDDMNAAQKLEVVIEVRTILADVCTDPTPTKVESSNYCEDIRKAMAEELRAVTSAKYIDDLEAANTGYAIFDASQKLSKICK